MGGALGICQGRAMLVTMLWLVGGVGVREGTMPLAQLSVDFQSLLPLATNKLGPFGANSQVGGFMCILGPIGSLQ